MTKIIGFILVIIVIIAGGLMLVSGKDDTNQQNLAAPTTDEYYWSTTCPHCAEVNEFLEEWKHSDKLEIQKYETGDTQNALRLQARAASCNIPRTQVGVPLLYTTEEKCLIGSEPIISYFKSKFEDE